MTLKAALAALTILLTTREATAEPLVWKDEWRPFQTWEYVATGTVSAALFASYIVAPNQPRRHGPILFDESVRDALLPDSAAGQSRATVVSNLTFWGLAAYPFFGDAVLTATLARKSPEVAAQMVLIDAEAMALNGLLFKILELSVARARPYVSDCIATGRTVAECNADGGGTTSMPSGHVSTAVTGAALICTHHFRLGLFGNAYADGAACGVGIAAAIASGISRIASDNHYTTDVLAGALIGVVAGWVVPTTLHYGWTSSQPKLARSLPVVPFVTTTSFGAAYIATL